MERWQARCYLVNFFRWWQCSCNGLNSGSVNSDNCAPMTLKCEILWTTWSFMWTLIRVTHFRVGGVKASFSARKQTQKKSSRSWRRTSVASIRHACGRSRLVSIKTFEKWKKNQIFSGWTPWNWTKRTGSSPNLARQSSHQGRAHDETWFFSHQDSASKKGTSADPRISIKWENHLRPLPVLNYRNPNYVSRNIILEPVRTKETMEGVSMMTMREPLSGCTYQQRFIMPLTIFTLFWTFLKVISTRDIFSTMEPTSETCLNSDFSMGLNFFKLWRKKRSHVGKRFSDTCQSFLGKS